MISFRRVMRMFALITLMAAVAGACTRPTSSTSAVRAQPLDLYGASPSLTDVRTLLGDSNWWPGPPSFGVRPLDSASMSIREKFRVTTRFVHVGTAETLDIGYTVWDSSSSATTTMTNVQSAFGTSAGGRKVGDQVLYYGTQGAGAAPYGTLTFVRVGQIVTTISLNLKDAFPKVAQLGSIATKVTSRLKDALAGKVHVSPLAVADVSLLPPAGPDMTNLASVRLPIEAIVVMLNFASPDALAGVLHTTGVDSIVFGDYVVNSDTHMEVRAGLLNFIGRPEAAAWVESLRAGHSVDQNGISTFYDNSTGQYFSLFAVGTKSAMLVCRSTAPGEAASRSCELPLSRVASAWQISLGG
ncbi:MAG: hypothetical protein NVS1B3_09900 [Candidatus Dormibacteraceae bacterium]